LFEYLTFRNLRRYSWNTRDHCGRVYRREIQSYRREMRERKREGWR
jgi:hypothetical protein